MAVIKYHSQKIKQGLGTGFDDAITSDSGNRAVATALLRQFLIEKQQNALDITDTFNRRLIRNKMLKYNSYQYEKAPCLVVSNLIEQFDVAEAVKNVTELLKARAIEPRPKLEQWSLEKIGAPILTEEELEQALLDSEKKRAIEIKSMEQLTEQKPEEEEGESDAA